MNQTAMRLDEAEDAEEVAPRPTKTRKRASAPAIAEPAQHQPPALAQPVDPQTAMIQMIERVALDPNASLEKLEKMLDLRERIEDRAKAEHKEEQRAAYYRAMAACQAALKVVKKNKKNDQTNSSYADLAALAKEADPIIHEHGFTFSTRPLGRTETGEERIGWTIAHTDGHIEAGEAAIAIDDKGPNGSKNKTAIHGFGSTMSYGRRYLKLMLFDIATGDDDDGNAAGAPKGTIDEEQYRVLRGLWAEAKPDDAKFFARFKITMLEELRDADFEAAKAALWQKIAANRKGPANAS